MIKLRDLFDEVWKESEGENFYNVCRLSLANLLKPFYLAIVRGILEIEVTEEEAMVLLSFYDNKFQLLPDGRIDILGIKLIVKK